MKKILTTLGFVAATVVATNAATLAAFNFDTSPFITASTVAGNVTVGDITITAGSITTNVTTGTYFPNEPYIQGNGGWTSATQTGAKAFQVTITAQAGYEFSVDNVSYNGYATGAGPSAIGFAVGSTNYAATNIPSGGSITAISSAVSQTGLTSITISLQGWDNGSRATSGGGDFRLDDLIISGDVVAVPEPSSFALLGLAGLATMLRRRR